MENQDFYLIHFIEAHDIQKNININIIDKNKQFTPEFEPVLRIPFVYKNSSDYISTIYCIKIPFSLKNFEILIELKENNTKNLFEKKISEKDIADQGNTHYIFLYDFEFKNKKGSFFNNPFLSSSNEFSLPLDEQFQIYLKLVRGRYQIDRDSSENEEFLDSIKGITLGKDKKIDFFFFISILHESYYSKNLLPCLMSFKYNKLIRKDNVSIEKLNIIKDMVDEFKDNPEIILKNIKDEHKEKMKINLYMIILYFYYFYQHAKMESIFTNKEAILILLKIISDNKDLFNKINLNKEKLNEIINQLFELNLIKQVLSYNNNSYDFFEIINKNKEKLFDLFYSVKTNKDNEDKKKLKELAIQVDKYVVIKKEDNLKKILKLIKKLLEYEIEQNTIFLYFSPEFFQQFAELSNENNLNNLYLLQDIIDNFMKRIDKSFKIKNLEKKINKTGIKYINNDLMNNNQILDFIRKDIYFSDKIYERSEERDINIFKKFNLEKIDNEFYLNWNQIKWKELVKGQEQKFLEIISSLVTKISHFNILFLILYENNEFNKDKVLHAMINAFNKNFSNFYLEEINDNFNIIYNLVY